MRMLLWGTFALVLAACSATTTAQSVYATSATFNVVLEGAVIYESLPRCNVAPAPCSDTEIVDKIRAASNAAAIAIERAESAVIAAAAARAAADLTGSPAAAAAATIAAAAADTAAAAAVTAVTIASGSIAGTGG